MPTIPEPTKTSADPRLETPTLLGVVLDYYLDPSPKDSNDPPYIDADRDGKPDVTVKLSLGRFFNEQL